jgi:hypothetical protein
MRIRLNIALILPLLMSKRLCWSFCVCVRACVRHPRAGDKNELINIRTSGGTAEETRMNVRGIILPPVLHWAAKVRWSLGLTGLAQKKTRMLRVIQ